MSFQEFSLDPRLAAAIDAIGYDDPTPIQSRAIPMALQGGDVLGIAQTGTGKTAAFMLPILQRLIDGPRGRVRALVLAPTRELAEQIREATTALSKGSGLRSVAVYGGVSKVRQDEALRRGAEIVVACPGRLLDHLGSRTIDLSQIEVLVLDEADRMCDMGFLPDIRRILRQLPVQRQTLFFAATMPDEIRMLANDILKNPATVQIGIIAPVETVSHAIYPVAQTQKGELLLALLRQTATAKVLVFTRTKRRAQNLANKLSKQGFRAIALQGNMTQNRRQSAIDGFRNGRYDILVATDVASRGIDISEISHVINFDMPDTVDAYTHRIGRTGRAESTGEALTLATAEDRDMLRAVERVLGAPIEQRRVPGFDYGVLDPELLFYRTPAAEKRAVVGHRTFRPRRGARRR